MSKPSKQVVIRLPMALYDAYAEVAEKNHRPLAQVLRETLWAHKPRRGA
jgi:hypothetical protein